MARITGLVLAAGIFLASFALHIVGGATDQGWLFASAVGLIYLSASAFGVIAWILAGSRQGERLTIAVGSVAGVALTSAALWAANDRSLAWWVVPLAAILTAMSSAVVYATWKALRRNARAQVARSSAGDAPGA
jgi:hypothetical protein